MIFDAELAKARAQRDAFAEKLKQVAAARAEVVGRLERCAAYATQFEGGLVQARTAGEVWSLPVYRTSWWDQSAWVEYQNVDPGNHRHVDREREHWNAALARLTHLRDKLDRKIKEWEERKFRVEYWLLEKEETWGKLDRDVLKGQVRDILLAADELSQLVVGRKVPVEFDMRDGGPLAYVPVHKHKDAGRKVFLSVRILGEQPEHLPDYYRALIVHELGHVLMHLKDSAREYRRFRRLMRDRVTRAPHFFDLFNVILDEQLERVLRDTKPEWQGWFNRLDFYTRRIPLADLKGILASAGRPDPDAVLADLTARRLVKVYPDPKRPFAAILSAGIFSEGLEFSRLFAFFEVLRHRLPRATVREPWLRECLDLIPKDFKTLDVFAVHALAVRVYKILFGATAGFVTVKVRRGAGESEVELPGTLLPGRGSMPDKVLVVRAKRRKGGGPSDGPAPGGSRSSQPDPESGPPAPPQVPPPPPTRIPRASTGHHRKSRAHPSTNPYRGPSIGTRPGWLTVGSGGTGDKEKVIARKKPAGRNKAWRERASRRAEKLAAKRAPEPPPRGAPPTSKVAESSDRDLERAAKLASTPTPAWSPPKSGDRSAALDRLVQEVRDEIDGVRREPLTIDRMAPDAAVAADRRNESDDGTFPPPDGVFTLRPDRATNVGLVRAIRPLVNILRPYIGVADPARVLEERLTAGRRLLSGALVKHLAYGETRLFADHRTVGAEQHAEVFVAVLIDTSASMKTDGRLDRAKRFAVLLAECLRDCPEVASAFLGFNQNVYRCGDHDEHSVGSLEPTGKTNEAAALDYLGAQFLDVPRRRKAVVVISDGLPTACSVESVRRVVRRLEQERGARCLHVAASAEAHPAYHRRADLSGEWNPGTVRALGRAFSAMLR